MKQKTTALVLTELIKNAKSGEAISGQMLAEKIGVSRNAVWKAIKQLQADGYNITATTNLGYMLQESTDEKLNAAEIKAYLYNNPELRVFVYDEIDSTNSAAKRLILDGTIPPFLVAADSQTAGRGRFGRKFYSPSKTGIYMSLVISPEMKLGSPVTVTAAAAVAVSRAIAAQLHKETEIKWVNDVFLDGKKICGILSEATSDVETGTIKNIIIGIGINLTTAHFPEEIADIAGCVSNADAVSNADTGNKTEVSRAKVIAAVADTLLQLTREQNNTDFLDEYRKRSCVVGKDINYFSGETRTEAHALGIDEAGGLIVKLLDGTIDVLRSGEITVRIKA